MAVADQTTPPQNAAPQTRRERLRRELTSEIVTIARRHLEEGGRAGVSWRGIAREVGMNPASLYTYFDSLDDVFTAVILDSFQRLGDAMQEAATANADAEARDRLIACARAYRAWAITHPGEFNLIFTDQIPGYAAPPDGPTVEAQKTIFGPLIDAIAELTGASIGDSDVPSGDVGPGPIGLWGMMHGFVMLEINHHLRFVDDVERMFLETLGDATERLLP